MTKSWGMGLAVLWHTSLPLKYTLVKILVLLTAFLRLISRLSWTCSFLIKLGLWISSRWILGSPGGLLHSMACCSSCLLTCSSLKWSGRSGLSDSLSARMASSSAISAASALPLPLSASLILCFCRFLASFLLSAITKTG